MAVTPGTKALTTDYDGLAGFIDGWFTSGCPTCTFGNPLQTYGWGGAAVPARTAPMTAAQMNYLVDRCNLAGDIIESFSVSLPQVVAGTPAAASQFNQLESASQSIESLRLNIDPAEMSIVSGVQDARTTVWGSGDSTSVDNIIRYTFSDFDEARYFFNSGGGINVSMGIAGGSTSSYLDWVTLFANMGSVTFDHDSVSQSGSGGSAETFGYYSLTTSWQQIFKQSQGGYGYGYGSGQTFTLYARRSSSGHWIEIWTDCTDYGMSTVDGTMTGTYRYRKLDNQTSGAVSLSITGPSVSVQETFE